LSLINLPDFPSYFRSYAWSNVNHFSCGYPGDRYPDFPWIKSLEERGARIVGQAIITASPTGFVREILSWGAGKNDPSMKFEAGLGNIALIALIQDVVTHIEVPRLAITAALKIPGFGLTYASKLLRFLRPDIYASLDSRIRASLLKANLLPKIHDSYDNSMIEGYVSFVSLCTDLCHQLEQQGIHRPACDLPVSALQTAWRVADLEMALFAWSARSASQ